MYIVRVYFKDQKKCVLKKEFDFCFVDRLGERCVIEFCNHNSDENREEFTFDFVDYISVKYIL